MLDQQHAATRGHRGEIEHRYGSNVHILEDPLALTLLARLCALETVQPEVNTLVETLYKRMIWYVINTEFPRRRSAYESRMQESLSRAERQEGRGVFEGLLIDRTAAVVSVDIARAGILPSLTCYNTLNQVLDPVVVRQDHLIMSRAVDDKDQVTGAQISGQKIGGPVDGRIVLFPDPMGATGASLSTAISYYKESFGGSPADIITLNLIITPQFIRRLRDDHPEVKIYALRLDRGMSPQEILETVPGSQWELESGLNDHDYIVPGGGGFGEIMNNAWV
jgi:uracil phosphoribosyltransferase